MFRLIHELGLLIPGVVIVAGKGVFAAVQNAGGQGGVDLAHCEGSRGGPAVDHVNLDLGGLAADLQLGEVRERGNLCLCEHVTRGSADVVIQGADLAAGRVDNLVRQSLAGVAVQIIQSALNALNQVRKPHRGVLGDINTTGRRVRGVDTNEVRGADAKHFHGLSFRAKLAAAKYIDCDTPVGTGLYIVGKAVEHGADGAAVGVDFGEREGQLRGTVDLGSFFCGGCVLSRGGGGGSVYRGLFLAAGSQCEYHGNTQQERDHVSLHLCEILLFC